MEQKIDKEVFDKFFTESYCPVDYTTVKEEFEQIASVGNDIFTGSYEARNLNRENFILYLTSEAYCDFEAAVQEAMDDLNPEILDTAIRDISVDSLIHHFVEACFQKFSGNGSTYGKGMSLSQRTGSVFNAPHDVYFRMSRSGASPLAEFFQFIQCEFSCNWMHKNPE